jgi:hypothetical protein
VDLSAPHGSLARRQKSLQRDRRAGLSLPGSGAAIRTARYLIAGATSENTRRSYATGCLIARTRAARSAHPALIATFLGHLRDRRSVRADSQLAAGGDPILSSRSTGWCRDRSAGDPGSARGARRGRRPDHGRATITAKSPARRLGACAVPPSGPRERTLARPCELRARMVNSR